MPKQKLTPAQIHDEAAAVRTAVNEALQAESGGEGLKLTGLEVLGFLGLKIVIPICCGLVSRALFDKYKDVQTVKKAELAMQELLNQQDTADQVSDDEILNHTIGRLIDEGVPKARARAIAQETLKRIKEGV